MTDWLNCINFISIKIDIRIDSPSGIYRIMPSFFALSCLSFISSVLWVEAACRMSQRQSDWWVCGVEWGLLGQLEIDWPITDGEIISCFQKRGDGVRNMWDTVLSGLRPGACVRVLCSCVPTGRRQSWTLFIQMSRINTGSKEGFGFKVTSFELFSKVVQSNNVIYWHINQNTRVCTLLV